jgi:hypothetical protein
LFDRAEVRSTLEARIANMTREERLARIKEIVTPMRKYLHELDDEQGGAEADAGETEA